MTLIIRTVVADFLVLGNNALIGIDAVNRQPLEHCAHCTVNLALLVGILNANEKHAVCVFCGEI